ncbi:MAG: hypothetical protein D6743_06065 [Calditrichaeota bacterium]|nr:MAG: hypothetical protein D6743_06065 [Calditrichota bacterium]
MTGLDEIPKDARGVESWIEIPHMNDLGMGRDLVFEFVAERLPSDYGQVQAFFRSRGAYSRYKALLLERGVLEEWYDFENSRKQAAIRQWCLDNGIDISD